MKAARESLAAKLLRAARNPFRTSIGRRFSERAIGLLCRWSGLDQFDVASRSIGIGKYRSMSESGEQRLLENTLPKLLPSAPLLLDIGANVGGYSVALRRRFPSARILAFEPSPTAFRSLEAAAKEHQFEAYRLALGQEAGEATLYDYAANEGSEHASLVAGVLTDLHGSKDVAETKVQLQTLDDFCASRQIQRIDFMKVDTEGGELSVLRGARRMLASGCIGAIQFEFNEMNVLSRTFLLDFYKTLDGFLIYRLDSDRLIPEFAYNSRNEQFRYQNFLAVARSLASRVS